MSNTNVWLTLFGPTTPGEPAAAVAANIRKAGADGLILFTSLYHGYRLIQRRYPARPIYSLETDRVFWKPDPAYYRGLAIQPQRSIDAGDADWVADLGAACRTEGIRFSPLIPVCAGERIVQDHPELAVTNIYGSRDRLFMCYNNPEVRAYRKAMLRELLERYPADAVMLDKIPQIMLEQRAFNGLFDAPLRTVGSMCFCEHCRAEAARRGLDMAAIQARAREIASRSLDLPPHIVESVGDQLIGDTEIPLLMLEEPLIRHMLEFRFDTAVAFVRELRDTARSINPKIVFQAAFVPPAHIGHDMTSPRAWLTIQSYRLYAGVLDEIHCVVHWPADVVHFETARAVRAAEERTRIVTGMRLYGATRPEEVAQLADAALAGGAQAIHFLGYDVTTNALLAELAKWSKRNGPLSAHPTARRASARAKPGQGTP